MSRPARLSAVVLDCDGVLLESVAVKTQAYRALFADHPEHLDAITSYHLAHGGVSRFEKIRHIYARILHRPLSEQALGELAARFAALSQEKVLAAPLVRGARKFLQMYHRRLHLFVVSGTPQDELENVLAHKGLRSYFKGIYGFPGTKFGLLGRILSHWAFAPAQLVVVGDASTDLEAAQAHGIRFVARVVDDGPGPFPSGILLERVRDLTELAALIKGRLEEQ